jgi:hypothetical protein
MFALIMSTNLLSICVLLVQRLWAKILIGILINILIIMWAFVPRAARKAVLKSLLILFVCIPLITQLPQEELPAPSFFYEICESVQSGTTDLMALAIPSLLCPHYTWKLTRKNHRKQWRYASRTASGLLCEA